MTFFCDGIGAAMIDVDALPWMPFVPYSNDVKLKLIRVNAISGEWITLLKTPGGMELPKHHHSGTVHVYTITGKWRYKEHDWVAGPGSFVYETASSAHTPVGEPGEDVTTLNIVQGDWNVVDENGAVLAIENWRSMMDRYLAFCKAEGIAPVDVSSFQGN
jgi:2,4'-dihydroxyacetophenone dioxygenase